ncbi:hypothetical protein [Actinomycetospora termitidis]|uniref:Uncharacterized protein n=1 Tax=Actinomycetospora termitidis TaxID=3053470 RepID=A0ABT7MJ08_9PSEU|nr:hypothetical protein [Actinomycetospora sp. Odt1-22]MDL5160466.1 hypothetical protein [Actinomycetospora sp. Odt1-22]
MGGHGLGEVHVPAAEDLDGDAELAGGGAGALHGALGAADLGAHVLDRDGDRAAGVIVGVAGVHGHDAREGLGGDVVARQDLTAAGDRGGQGDAQPVVA